LNASWSGSNQITAKRNQIPDLASQVELEIISFAVNLNLWQRQPFTPYDLSQNQGLQNLQSQENHYRLRGMESHVRALVNEENTKPVIQPST
jgi:hypothetical protein